MASITRSNVLRQAFTSAPSKQISSRTASTLVSASRPAAQQSFRSAFAQRATPSSSRIAAFHATGSKAILPPLPQAVTGDVNTPARVPEPSPSHGSYHWTFERLISAGIVPLTMAPFIGGSLNPLLDGVFCAALLAHSHIGWDAMITDYFPAWRVPKVRAALNWTLRIATVLVGVGLYEFETNDVGVTEAIKRIWKA
ncbi:Fumarate reductase respiratory complex transmembrane subunit [Venturia nashicola]|uniref:Succinate dehydrogenase [ubiquinone] cytochrome b small subunit n=1 Tax=Venturia nashicola TaxID=86259 RepID=A0A4Z1PD30_9PEZI|nr:Fumarate reductase respiratory complex transmembrane subunit [Venturia nashicola]TLD38622.1 Fumarate reductase respiratory complex transmembrane subunit [Venturia nashicola]